MELFQCEGTAYRENLFLKGFTRPYVVISLKFKSSVWMQQHGQVSPKATNKRDQRHRDNSHSNAVLCGCNYYNYSANNEI